MSDGLTLADLARDFEENVLGYDIHSGKALILVDIQKDFCEGGSLEVPNASKIIPIVNKLMREPFDIVIATKDWHPKDHKSFASNHKDKKPFEVIKLNGIDQVLWPDHCVQDSEGAMFHDDLDADYIDLWVEKGIDPEVDSYSGFFDNNKEHETKLIEYLNEQDIDTVYIVGLATDYCVKATALDANELDFWTFVITDGVRGLDGAENALKELEEKGIELITSDEVII